MDDAEPYASVSVDDAQDLLALWFENSPLGMTMLHLQRRAFRINRAFAEMLGYSVQELLDSPDQSCFTHPSDLEIDRRNVERLIAEEQVMTRWDKRYIHADGHEVWARVTLFMLRSDDGTPRVLIAQIEDQTWQREIERKLALAEQDSLTGLINRSAFERAAAEQLARCKRYGEHAALLMLDLDQLKQINDTYGHMVGDDALKTVGKAVSERLRSSDLACRFGGDEFVVLLPYTATADAQTVADQIELTIRQTPVTAPAGAVHVTASIGIAHIDANTPDTKTALSDADASMYSAKRRRPLGESATERC